MEHILALNVTSISLTPLQGVEMIAVVRMGGDLFKDELFVRLPLVDAKGSSKIPNCNEDINYFLVDQRSLKLGSPNFIVEIWPKEFLDEKTSMDKKIGDEKTGGEKKAGDLFSPMEELLGSKKVGEVLIPVENSLKLGSLKLNVEIWAKESLDEKKAGDLFSPMEELLGSKKVGDVLIPIDELFRNKAGGNEHSGSYVLRRASGEAKVMLSLSVKIVDITMPNDSDSAADGATCSAYRYTPSQPNTGYIPAPGHFPLYTQGAYTPYDQTYPSNPYSAPYNQFVPPVSHAYNYYNQGYPSYHVYNPHIQGYPPFHGYSHAPQQPTSTLGWVCTGLNIVHDFLQLAELLGEPIMDGFGGEEFGGA